MKSIKIIMTCFVFTLALTIAGCKKTAYNSRDTSGIVPEPVEEEPVDPTLVVLDNADKLDGWEVSGGTGSIQTTLKKEGEGAIGGKFKAGEDYLHFIRRISNPVNSKLSPEKAQLSFWLYLDKQVSIKEGQIEISSSGEADQQEFHWEVPAISGLKPGWNEIKLKVSAATAENGGADLSSIKWFRMYMITTEKLTEEVQVVIDHLRFSEAAPDGPSLFFDNCDNLLGWEVSGGTGVIDGIKKKEGAGSIFGKTHDAGYLHFKKKLEVPVNTKLTKLTGQLTFWLYLSKAASLNGQIEISSSGEADQKEYNWDPATIKGLKPGAWNEVKLNIRDAAISNGPVDLAAINFFRMYLETGEAGIDIGIDGIKFNEVAPPDAVFLDNADLKDGWETVGAPVIELSSPKAKEGIGFLKNTIKKGEDFMQFIKNTTAPINANVTETNGQFKFWWYISDVSALKADGSIEITSSGKSDEKESAWDVSPLLPQLVNGWNQISLDFDKSNKTADGGADYKAINHFRIFFFTKDKTHEDIVTGIDDLKFVMKP